MKNAPINLEDSWFHDFPRKQLIVAMLIGAFFISPASVYAFTDYSRTPSDFTNVADPTTFQFELSVNPESAWNYHKFWISDPDELFFTYSDTCTASTGFEIITDTISAPIAQYSNVGVNEYSDDTCETFENQIQLDSEGGDIIFEVIAPESEFSATTTPEAFQAVDQTTFHAVVVFFISVASTLWILRSFMG